MCATPDLLFRQQPEAALHLVDPGRGCRREMAVPARPLGEPVADQLRLVAGGVVQDHVDVEISRDRRLHRVEELAELCCPVDRRV